LTSDVPSTNVDGVSEAGDLATAASSADPRTGLRAVLALRRLAESLEALQVDNARHQGWSWQEIAEALRVSKQAVHKKHSGRPSKLSREE
jgi:hypothetical protein